MIESPTISLAIVIGLAFAASSSILSSASVVLRGRSDRLEVRNLRFFEPLLQFLKKNIDFGQGETL